MLKGKRAVVFDLDGTLIDSEDFIVWTFVEAGRITGIRVDPDLVRRHIGEPLEVVLDAVLPGLPSSRVEEFVRVRKELVKNHWRFMVKLFPDVEPALRYLRARGFLVAVASSSIVERIAEFLGGLGILQYFNAISGVTTGVRGKPEPDVILDAVRRLGVDNAEVVYVGDKEVDCVASARAGVDFVLVDRKGVFSNIESFSCRPVTAVKNLVELLNLL